MTNEIIKVNYETNRPTVMGRDLHKALEIETPYRIWFPRMCEYGFTENKDYTPYIFVHPLNKQEITDHQLTLDMAKEICMIQRSDKGKMYREYFLELERKWNDPETLMARALKLADKQILMLSTENKELKRNNEMLATKNEILVADTLAWDARPTINSIVRKYATTVYGMGNYSFASAWTDFKKELLYKYGININSRITEYLNKTGKKTKPKTLDMLTEEEIANAMKTVVSLCEDRGVNISELLSKTKIDSVA